MTFITVHLSNLGPLVSLLLPNTFVNQSALAIGRINDTYLLTYTQEIASYTSK